MSKHKDQLVEEWFANISVIKRLTACQMNQFDGGIPLTPSQGELLLIVQQEQLVSLKELATTMRLTPGAITQLVESLERGGLVQRVPSPTDRRVTNVILTKDGQQTITTFRKKHRDFLTYMATPLTTDEIQATLNIQRKMIDFLNQPQPERNVIPDKKPKE